MDSGAELIGILGELQTLILFTALEKKVPNGKGFLDFVGNVKNKDGEKVGIDVILNGEGIQVKNYSTYGQEGLNEGFILSNELTLENFLERISAALGQD